jgi:hypothetical protein
MKRTTIIAMMLTAAITMMLCGCSSEEMLSGIASESKTVPISVTDAGFVSAVGKQTRTAEDGVKTTFSKDDAIGIYVTDGSTVKYTNLKYTYDDAKSSWTNTTYGANVPFVAGGKYFAYYPYQDTYTEATLATDVTANATTPEAFFEPIINAWTPATDQSTHANYTAQDLMVAQGSFATDHYTFSLAHQMALVEVDFAQVRYFYDGGVRDKYSFDTYTPYHIGKGQYRILVKPNDATMSMNGKIYGDATAVIGNWSFAETSPAKSVTKVYQLNNEAASEKTGSYSGIAVGQLYYSDGTYSSTYDENKTPIGIIVSTTNAYCEPSSGYGHGLVMALHDASAAAAWGSILETVLPSIEGLSDYIQDYSGLNNTKKIESAHSSELETSNPAFYYAYVDYNKKCMTPSTSSVWFLPSIGQLIHMMEQLVRNNNQVMQIERDHNTEAVGYECSSDIGKFKNAQKKISDKYTNLQWDIFGEHYYLASTQCNRWSLNKACAIGHFLNNLVFDIVKKLGQNYVRPFLAF